MGACASNLTPEERQALAASKRIEKDNYQDFNTELEKIKLLLLGAGESGKSTLFKQMKILYGAGFTDSEKRLYLPRIGFNVVEGMHFLCQAVMERGLQAKLDPASSPYVEQVLSVQPGLVPPDAEMAEMVNVLWKDPAIQEVWSLRSELQVNEAIEKFFNKIDELAEDDYLPTEEDILYCRNRTTGITSQEYLVDSVNFCLYDVGGQRNERKKWIHCFDDVAAVLFVAALSEYDQTLFEDATENRMVDAISLFKWVCAQGAFADTSMILFLNKRDLFEKKVQTVPIRSVEHFADFSGKDANFTDGVAYFQGKFEAQAKSRGGSKVITHITCATDRHTFRQIFNACKIIILEQHVQGMM